ncbi:DMT family transporter [bacterium]|nr:DMT family transporter [bacterium]
MRHDNRFGLPDIAMIVTCFMWGINAVITKNAVGNSPETFRIFIYNGLRIPIGAMLLVGAMKLSGGSLAVQKRHIPYIAALAFFGMFMFMIAFIVGISLTSSANAGIITGTTPLLILVVSFFSGIERPSVRTVTGITVGFCGMLALTFKQGGITFNTGDFLLFCSSLFWAFHTVYGKKVLTVYSPVAAMIWIYIFTSIYQLPLIIYQIPGQALSTVTPINWFYLAVSAIGSIFLANGLYYYSITKIGPSKVGVYTNLTPVFTLILAVIIRGESIDRYQIAGLLFIIMGIAIAKSGYRVSDSR